MPLIERRYAEALIDISIKDNSLNIFQSVLQDIVEIYNRNPELKIFLLDPEINPDAKKEVIRKVFEGIPRIELVNFLMLLLDKGRFSYLPGILREFIVLADANRKTLNMSIISPKPLDDSQVSRLKEKYQSLYNAASVKANLEIDESLIGGVKVKIGDKVYDNTLKGRLKDLKELILKS